MVIDLQLVLAAAAGILIIINLLALFLRKDDKKLQSIADVFYRGQAELAGRLSQMAETNQQQQHKISEAIAEQRLSVLKMMDEKLLQVTKNVGEGLQKTTVQTNQTLTDLRERLAKIDAAQQKISALSEQVVSLQEVLSNKQARGRFWRNSAQ